MLVADLIYECLLQRRRSSLKQLFKFPVFERRWLRERYPHLPPAWRRPQTIISEHCPVDDRICHRRKSVYRYHLIYDEDNLIYVMVFSDDVLHYEYQVKDGKIHGLVIIYDHEELLACFLCVEGKREGAHYSFYSNGNVRSVSHTLNDQIHGPWIDYREDGTVKHVRRYENNMLVLIVPVN